MSAIVMNKVDFTNGSGEPINDANLNAIQDNAETAINVVQTNLENRTNNITRYYNAWGTSIDFYVPMGHQAIVLVSNSAVYLVWNPNDQVQSGAVFGSGVSFSRDTTDTTKITASRTGSATWTVLVL